MRYLKSAEVTAWVGTAVGCAVCPGATVGAGVVFVEPQAPAMNVAPMSTANIRRGKLI